MGMGFAPTWLRQVTPPASQNHFNHCMAVIRYEPVSERVVILQIKAKPRNITATQAYSPTTTASEDDINNFYQWRRNRGFRRFNEPGPPSSWAPE